MSKLTFDRENALRYQMYLVDHLINKQESQLQSLMQTKQQRVDMRMIMNESPLVWTTAAELLRPETQMYEMEKTISFQRHLKDFLVAKKRAIELLLIDEKDPKVSMVYTL